MKMIKSKKAEFTLAFLGFFVVLAKFAFWLVVLVILFLIFFAIFKALFAKAAKGLPKKWENQLMKYFK